MCKTQKQNVTKRNVHSENIARAIRTEPTLAKQTYGNKSVIKPQKEITQKVSTRGKIEQNPKRREGSGRRTESPEGLTAQTSNQHLPTRLPVREMKKG